MEIEIQELIRNHSSDNLGEGTPEEKIRNVEQKLGIQIPNQYRIFLKTIGYTEIFGDEIYSIYDEEGDNPNLGIYYQNKKSEELEKGFLKFFSNDIDGIFFISLESEEVILNYSNNVFAKSFNEFIFKLINS